MPRLKVTEPIISGSIRGSLDLTSVSNTDWNNLTSADFIDTTTGIACDASLKFEWIGFINGGSDVMYIKYRARTSASDPTTNEIAVGQVYSDDLVTLRTQIKTISYKKASASDIVRIIAGFSAI